MIEKIAPLHKVKAMREKTALRRLRAKRDRLSEVSRIRLECELAVKESADNLPHRENAIFQEIIQKVVDSREIDSVREDVFQLHRSHQQLEDNLENAMQEQHQLVAEVESAHQAHVIAQRAYQKFDLALEDLLHLKATLDDQTEEGEMEDIFRKGRQKHA